MEALTIQLVAMAICGCICAAIASSKGRTPVGWFFAGFLGILGIIIIAVVPNVKEQKAKEEAIERENRRLREQLLQEQIKTEAFRRHASARLDAHDSHIGVDTRQLTTGLPAPDFPAALPDPTNDRLNLGNNVLPDANAAARNLAMNGSGDAIPPPVPAGFEQQWANANPQANPASVSPTRVWYYDMLGATRGPISDSELVALAQRGEVNGSTLLWTEQLSDWKPASLIKALRPYLQT